MKIRPVGDDNYNDQYNHLKVLYLQPTICCYVMYAVGKTTFSGITMMQHTHITVSKMKMNELK
jgi:hypothetical protein